MFVDEFMTSEVVGLKHVDVQQTKWPRSLFLDGCSLDPVLPVPFSHRETGLWSNSGWEWLSKVEGHM